MIPVPSNTKIWLAAGRTDMRRGFPGLSALVEKQLKSDAYCSHLFVFRGKKGDLIKIIWWAGNIIISGGLSFLKTSGIWPLRLAVCQRG